MRVIFTLLCCVLDSSFFSTQCKSGDVVEVRVGGDFHFPPALYHSSLPQAAVVCHGVPTSIGQEESNDGSRPLPSTVADCDVLLIGGGVGINPLYSVLTEVTTPSPTVSSRDAASHCEPSGTPSPSRGIAGSSVHVQSVTLLHSTQALDELLFRVSCPLLYCTLRSVDWEKGNVCTLFREPVR